MPVSLRPFVIAFSILLAGISPKNAEADSLTITPSRVVLPLGGAQRLELRDASGAVVSGAEWSLSVPDVVSLSTTPKVTIAASGAGEVTVVATASGQTAEATVIVLAAIEAPPETPLWKVSRVTPDDGAPSAVVSAQNDDGTGADYFLLEASYSSPAVRGLRLDGTEAWRRPLGANLSIVQTLADASGGLVVSTYDYNDPNGCALLRIDGQSGLQTWRITGHGCFLKPALQPSGKVVVPSVQGYNVYTVGVDPVTGVIGFETLVGGTTVCGSYFADPLSDLTIGSDGKAYALRTHSEMAVADCNSFNQYTIDIWVDLVAVQPNGSLAIVTQLAESHGSSDFGSAFEFVSPGQVFPSPSGGLTLTWYRAKSDGSEAAHLFVTTLDGSRSDLEVSTWVEAVGSDGSGYGHRSADGVLASISTLSGAPKWASTETGAVTAVLADLSVATLNAAGELVRVDGAGLSSPLGSAAAYTPELLLDSPDQRLTWSEGNLVAVPGGGLELDGLFPVQDGNTKRQRARPVPALTVSRGTVTRGETATFRLSGVLLSELVEWRFVPDDNNLPPVVRTSSNSLVWAGRILAAGEVRATILANGTPKELVRHLDVAPRSGFSLHIVPPQPQQEPHGFTPPGTGLPMLLPSPPYPPSGGQPASAMGQYHYSLPYVFDYGGPVNDQGPNAGYRSVDGIQLDNGQGLLHYVYVIVPDLEPDQEFYQRQCGTWSESNPTGGISGPVLRQNTIHHESGLTGLSHYVQFVAALALPEHDLAAAIETVVIGGAAASDDTSFGAAVKARMKDGVLREINDAVRAEPCPTSSYDGSSGICVNRGLANYPPYQPCP